MKLQIDLDKFMAVTLMDTLNYSPVFVLEESISHTANYVLTEFTKKYDNTSMTIDQKMDFYLKKMLLCMSSNKVWIRCKEKYNLTEEYLYHVMKKYYFKYTNEIDFV